MLFPQYNWTFRRAACNREGSARVHRADGNRAGHMNREAPFATVLALTLLPILMAPALGREKTTKQPVAILPPADGPVERLEAQPRLPIEVVPLSGSEPAPGLSQERHQREGAVDPTTAHVCGGAKMSPS